MQVRTKVVVHGGKGSREAIALFDTGARSTYISNKLATELGYEPMPRPKTVRLAVKGKYGEVVGNSTLTLEIDGYKLYPYTVRVIKDLEEELIVGTSLMEEFEVELDLKAGEAKLKKYPPEFTLI